MCDASWETVVEKNAGTDEAHHLDHDLHQLADKYTLDSDFRSKNEELLASGCSTLDQVTDSSERATCLMDYLPESLLLQMFSYLKFNERSRCAQVCKRWNRIIKDRSLLKVIDVSNTWPTFKQFVVLVNTYCTPNLVDFKMASLKCDLSQQSDVYSRAMSELAKKCPSLKKLTLKHYINCNSDSVFSIKNLPKMLVHLCLRGSVFYPYYFFGRSPHEHLPNLKCLDVGEAANITSNDIGMFSYFRNLQNLYLDGCIRINYGGIEHIIDILPQLCVLDLEGTDINNLGLCCILENCINIKELFIGHTDVTGEAFFALKGNIASHLQKLCIKNTCISSHAIHYFITQCFAGKKVILMTGWLEITPKCLTRHSNCHIISLNPEFIVNKPCCHFQEHVCTK